MQLWKEKVWKSYVQGMMRSALILNRMESFIHPDFIDAVDELRTRIINIPEGFTSVFLACVVGIMKPFKTRFTLVCHQWNVSEYALLGVSGRTPTTGRSEAL